MIIENNTKEKKTGVKVYLKDDSIWHFLAKRVRAITDPEDRTTSVTIIDANDIKHHFLISCAAGHFVHEVELYPGQSVDI